MHTFSITRMFTPVLYAAIENIQYPIKDYTSEGFIGM